jgi:hypothetical protein
LGDERTADFTRIPVHLVLMDVGKHMFIRLASNRAAHLLCSGSMWS